MMTIGKPVSASGAEAYFKADFIKQAMRLKKSADKNIEAVENTRIEQLTDRAAEVELLTDAAAEVLIIGNTVKIEDSGGGNSMALKDENSIAESEPIKQAGREEEGAAEDLTAEDLTAEVSAVPDSSSGLPITKNPTVEQPSTENPVTENSSIEEAPIERSSFDKNVINFTQTRTRWLGKLSEELGLTGEVAEKEFAALSRGIHPQTGEQFIRHVKPRTVTDERGKTRQTKAHRAGLDQTINAPKSVSLAALYDERVIAAHWRSAIKAIEIIEEFTMAKMGNVKPPERTGEAAYAAFLHTEARPDFKTNYAAPDLHTHFFEFNVARTADGRHRAMETREIYRCQKLATAVYRSELLKEMTAIGYEMRIDEKTGAPEIASISRAYIEASSPRQTEIKRTAEELGIKSTKIVASNYRRGKNFDPVEMRRRWDELDVKFGSQAAKAAEQARHRTEILRSEKQPFSPHRQTPDSLNTAERTESKAAAAVDFVIARAKEQKDIEVSKRQWITRQSLLTEALNYSPAELRIAHVKAEFTEREKNGDLQAFDLDRRKTKLQSKQENKILPVSRKGFTEQEKSASEVSPTIELPNPSVSPEQRGTIHQKISEIKLENTQDSKESLEKIYDKTGILQSRTRTGGSGSQESDLTADHITGAKPANRTFRVGEFGGTSLAGSNISSPITGSTVIGGSPVLIASNENGESASKHTDSAADRHRGSKDSASEARTGAQQNLLAGRRERELSGRGGSAGSRKSDDERITERSVEKGENGGESVNFPFQPIDPAVRSENAVTAKPDFQPKTSEMETTPRLESDAGVEEIEIAGAKSAPLRNHRTGDQTTGGGQEITGNDGANFSAVKFNGAENTGVDAESERGVDRRENRINRRENRDRETKGKHLTFEFGAETSRTMDERGGSGIEDGDQRIATLSRPIGDSQVTNDKGFKDEGFVGTRISDDTQRAAGKRTSNAAQSIDEIEGADRFDSRTNSEGKGGGNYERTTSREKSRMDGSHTEVVNRAVNFSDAGNGVLLWDKQGFERESGGATTNDGRITAKIIDSAGSPNENGRKFQQHGDHASTIVTGSGKILPSAADGADEDRPDSLETRRRTAEKTTQIINIKRFSGGLDPQIVEEWTAVIEKSDAADFLNEVVKTKSREQEQQLFGHLDTQAALIAERLKLPKPELEAKPNAFKLAVALTKIEAANYEQAVGEPLRDKVFEVLIKNNMSRAAAPPQAEQIELLQNSLTDPAVKSILKSSSSLEAETLDALLDPVRRGFDASAVIQAQQEVGTNESAARETATLVQIAYGGQINAFTDNFKNDLAERIYYAPVSAIDTYQNFRQSDWRQTVETFAPAVSILAEQYKIEIKPPDSDLDRNKQLADFVARQLVEAYESQNKPMEKYVQTQLTANILRAGGVDVSQPQKDTIAASTDQNLEPPKFSSALEASAYNTTKYDDEKKAIQAIRLTDQIREVAQVRAEKQAVPETVKVPILIMR